MLAVTKPFQLIISFRVLLAIFKVSMSHLIVLISFTPYKTIQPVLGLELKNKKEKKKKTEGLSL